MRTRGRKYRQALERIEPGRLYPPRTALRLAKETSVASFDATVEAAFRLGIDPRKADQMVRGAVALPSGTGQSVRVAVVSSGENLVAAQEAGADHAGGDELVEQLEELAEQLDAVVATPDMMSKLGRLGKVLGPRGLMPNPKSGTVTQDVGRAVREIKGGRVEFRTDRTANVHTRLGKVSFDLEQLLENFEALYDELARQRPASAKGRYFRTITVSTTMGPGIRIDPSRARAVQEDVEEGAGALAGR